MKILRLVAIAVGLVLLLAIAISSGLLGTVDAAGPKIDLRVRAATANGGQAPVLIVLSEQADLSGAARLTSKQEKGRYVFNALTATARRTQPAIRAQLDRLGYSYRSYYIVNMFAVENATQAGIEQLAGRSDIKRIESNARVRMDLPQPVRASSSATLTASGIPWGVQKIKAPAVWSLGIRGQGIVYANADTGIDWTHPALKLHYRGFNGRFANHSYNWWDAVHDDVSGNGTNPCGFSSSVPCDDYGHGTHTLGTGIGNDYRGNAIGVAPQARWIGCRNMEEGWGTPAQYIECFQFFLAPWNQSGNNPNPDRNADVISNSWTCPPDEGCAADTLRDAVRAERFAGIFVVGSAGNTGYAGCSSVTDPPAIYDATFTIAATDNQDRVAGFSSLGPVTVDGSNRVKPDLAAPGVAVLSALKGGGYGTMSGTSMASPHVAGAVALIWQGRPSLRGQVAATEQLLFKSAVRRVTTSSICGGTTPQVIPNNMFGYGRLDLLKVYQGIR